MAGSSGNDGQDDPGAGDRAATRLAHAGRRPEWTMGVVNPPVFHASTVVFRTLAELDAAVADPDGRLYYGRRGTPTSWALESALSELEPGAAGTRLFPSGVAALAAALLACLDAGDHVLVVDSAYEPTRGICNSLLRKAGIDADFYDPAAGSDIARLFRDNTRAVLVESPGSLTFEVQDVPAIAAAAHARGLAVIMDNTWATPLYFPALAHGVDLSVQSLTKYVVGHADAMMGAVTANAALWPRLKAVAMRLGQCAGPDDVYLALRGLRTLKVRLDRHQESALAVARWLSGHAEVAQVLHPALEGSPGHALWARDFKGASGLFSIVLKRGRRADLAALVDGMRLFRMGFSWGGFESLVLPADPAPIRSATRWQAPGPLLRLHIGLEDVADLIADLDAGLARYAAAL